MAIYNKDELLLILNNKEVFEKEIFSSSLNVLSAMKKEGLAFEKSLLNYLQDTDHDKSVYIAYNIINPRFLNEIKNDTLSIKELLRLMKVIAEWNQYLYSIKGEEEFTSLIKDFVSTINNKWNNFSEKDLDSIVDYLESENDFELKTNNIVALSYSLKDLGLSLNDSFLKSQKFFNLFTNNTFAIEALALTSQEIEDLEEPPNTSEPMVLSLINRMDKYLSSVRADKNLEPALDIHINNYKQHLFKSDLAISYLKTVNYQYKYIVVSLNRLLNENLSKEVKGFLRDKFSEIILNIDQHNKLYCQNVGIQYVLPISGAIISNGVGNAKMEEFIDNLDDNVSDIVFKNIFSNNNSYKEVFQIDLPEFDSNNIQDLKETLSLRNLRANPEWFETNLETIKKNFNIEILNNWIKETKRASRFDNNQNSRENFLHKMQMETNFAASFRKLLVFLSQDEKYEDGLVELCRNRLGEIYRNFEHNKNMMLSINALNNRSDLLLRNVFSTYEKSNVIDFTLMQEHPINNISSVDIDYLIQVNNLNKGSRKIFFNLTGNNDEKNLNKILAQSELNDLKDQINMDEKDNVLKYTLNMLDIMRCYSTLHNNLLTNEFSNHPLFIKMHNKIVDFISELSVNNTQLKIDKFLSENNIKKGLLDNQIRNKNNNLKILQNERPKLFERIYHENETKVLDRIIINAIDMVSIKSLSNDILIKALTRIMEKKISVFNEAVAKNIFHIIQQKDGKELLNKLIIKKVNNENPLYISTETIDKILLSLGVKFEYVDDGLAKHIINQRFRDFYKRYISATTNLNVPKEHDHIIWKLEKEYLAIADDLNDLQVELPEEKICQLAEMLVLKEIIDDYERKLERLGVEITEGESLYIDSLFKNITGVSLEEEHEKLIKSFVNGIKNFTLKFANLEILATSKESLFIELFKEQSDYDSGLFSTDMSTNKNKTLLGFLIKDEHLKSQVYENEYFVKNMNVKDFENKNYFSDFYKKKLREMVNGFNEGSKDIWDLIIYHNGVNTLYLNKIDQRNKEIFIADIERSGEKIDADKFIEQYNNKTIHEKILLIQKIEELPFATNKDFFQKILNKILNDTKDTNFDYDETKSLITFLYKIYEIPESNQKIMDNANLKISDKIDCKHFLVEQDVHKYVLENNIDNDNFLNLFKQKVSEGYRFNNQVYKLNLDISFSNLTNERLNPSNGLKKNDIYRNISMGKGKCLLTVADLARLYADNIEKYPAEVLLLTTNVSFKEGCEEFIVMNTKHKDILLDVKKNIFNINTNMENKILMWSDVLRENIINDIIVKINIQREKEYLTMKSSLKEYGQNDILKLDPLLKIHQSPISIEERINNKVNDFKEKNYIKSSNLRNLKESLSKLYEKNMSSMIKDILSSNLVFSIQYVMGVDIEHWVKNNQDIVRDSLNNLDFSKAQLFKNYSSKTIALPMKHKMNEIVEKSNLMFENAESLLSLEQLSKYAEYLNHMNEHLCVNGIYYGEDVLNNKYNELTEKVHIELRERSLLNLMNKNEENKIKTRKKI